MDAALPPGELTDQYGETDATVRSATQTTAIEVRTSANTASRLRVGRSTTITMRRSRARTQPRP